MRLIDELRSEHQLIEKAAGSLRTFAARRATGEADPADGARFLAFFRHYAGTFHHAREEDILLPTLVKELELRQDSGPIRSIIDQHHSMAATLSSLAPLLGQKHLGEAEKEQIVSLANDYVRALWQHIDAENSVLLPECETRLRRAGVMALDDHPPSDDQVAARAEGERLVVTYLPRELDVLRGDGCACCPSYGVRCDGVEREWWNEVEWEDVFHRIG